MTEGANDVVGDDENLYRSIRDGSNEYARVGDAVKFSSSAFNDRTMKPSVDRARLRGSPHDSKKSPTDGIALLVTEEVRAIRKVQRHSANKSVTQHDVDVLPVPLPDNPAHGEVRCQPALESDSTFRKLKEALARLADKRGWLIPPASWIAVASSSPTEALSTAVPSIPSPSPNSPGTTPAREPSRAKPVQPPRIVLPALSALAAIVVFAWFITRC